MTRDRVATGDDRARFAAASAAARAGERRMTIWLFAASCACCCCSTMVVFPGWTGRRTIRLRGPSSTISAWTLVADSTPRPAIGGHQYAKSNVGLPLLAAVFYLLSAPVSRFAPAHSYFTQTALVGASMTLITAAIVVAVYRLARTLGARPSSALIVGIGAVAGTYLLPYSKEFFAEPLSALGLVIAIERALADRPVAAGTGLAIAVLARAQSLLCLPALIFVIVRRCGVRGGVRAAGPVGVSILLTAAYNMARFGNPLSSAIKMRGSRCRFCAERTCCSSIRRRA